MKPSSTSIPRTLLCVVLASLAGITLAEDPTAESFDVDGDGRLSADELKVYFRHQHSDVLPRFDRDYNGVISEGEKKAGIDELNKLLAAIGGNDESVPDAEIDLLDLQQVLGPRSDYSIGEVQGYLQEPPESTAFKFITDRNIRVRRTYDELYKAVFKKVTLEKGTPAIFSYSRNLENNANTWTARGAIGYLHPLEDKEFLGLDNLSLVPSLSFDRVDTDDPAKGGDEVNSLILRAGFSGSVLKQPDAWKRWPDLSEFRLAAAYATDIDFDSKVIAGELDWEPTWIRAGMGVYRSMKPIDFRWRTFLHSEVGHNIEAGDKPNIDEDDDFFRVGPQIEASFRFQGLEELNFFGSYRYLWGISGTPQAARLWKAGATWQLDRAGHLSLQAAYENGDLPLVNDPIDAVTIGLGIKF